MPNASVPAADIGLPFFLFDDELVHCWRELQHAEKLDAGALIRENRLKIESIPATGFAGLFAKARAAELALRDGEAGSREPGSFLRLSTSMIRDLKAIEARMLDCPVEKIARVAAAIIEASRILEEEKPDDGEEQEAQLMERLADLEQAATSAPACSAIGAMAQVCMASNLLAEIEENGFSARTHRRLRRSLYSIIGMLEAMAGERAGIVRGYYFCPELDPFNCRSAKQNAEA